MMRGNPVGNLTPLRSTLLYVLLTAGAFFFAVPFLWMISCSLKANESIFVFPPQWLPEEWLWSNYYRAMTIMPFHLFIRNSVLVTLMNIVGNVLSCSLVAFGFAYFRFPYKRTLFVILLSTMMLPAQVTMIPLFELFAWFGWIDTFKPLIVPAFLGPPFFVFLYRQFFMTLPRDLFEAARIDGCGSFRIYWNIAFPLITPATITVTIFTFMWTWNDFLGPLIYLNSEEKYTLALGLASFRGQYFSDWNLLMAASVIAVLPCIVLFFLCQRHFVQGVVTSGLKA